MDKERKSGRDKREELKSLLGERPVPLRMVFDCSDSGIPPANVSSCGGGKGELFVGDCPLGTAKVVKPGGRHTCIRLSSRVCSSDSALLRRLGDARVLAHLEVGRCSVVTSELKKIIAKRVVAFDEHVDAPVSLYLQGVSRAFARGELLRVDDCIGFRPTTSPDWREALSLVQPAVDFEEPVVNLRAVGGQFRLGLPELLTIEEGSVIQTSVSLTEPLRLVAGSQTIGRGFVAAVDGRRALRLWGGYVRRRISGSVAATQLESLEPAPLDELARRVRALPVDVLSSAVAAEHPQTIAFTLSFLEPSSAARVLERVSPAVRGEVVCRLSRLGRAHGAAAATVLTGLLDVAQPLVEYTPERVDRTTGVLESLDLGVSSSIVREVGVIDPKLASELAARLDA